MHTCFDKKLNFLFFLGLSFLLLVSVISFITIKKSTDLAESVQKRQLIIRQLETLLSNVKDAETGVRAFALTNDTFFLTPYVGTHEKTVDALDNLFIQLKTNSTQKLDLLRLEAIVNTRFETMEKGLSCMKINTPIPASLINEGNLIMNQTREVIHKMQDFETRQIARETADWKKLGYATHFLIITAFLLSIIIALFFLKRLKINLYKREKIQEEMVEKDALINQRITLIQGIADKIALGNYHLRLKEEEKDTLGDLAVNLNRMAKTLETSFNTINESMRKKDKFMNIAAHELKTPLTVIKSSLEIINKLDIGGMEGEILRSFNSKALHQVNQLTQIVKHLLDVTRINEGTLELKLEKFSIEDVILESSEKIADNIPKPEIRFIEHLKPTVYADRIRVKEVLSHFITYARKYSPDKSKVSIEVKTEGEHVKVAVKDRGIEIPKDKLPLIFEKYFKLEESSKIFSGLGLGLFISKSIIEAHRGSVGVESNEDKGSTFWFTLPLNSPIRHYKIHDNFQDFRIQINQVGC